MDTHPTSSRPATDKPWTVRSSNSRVVTSRTAFNGLPTAERFSQQVLTRSDIRTWCIAVVIASTIFSGAAITIGVVIVRNRSSLPFFLKDRCTSVDVVKIPWVGDIPMYQIWHYAFPSTASGSLILLLFINLLLTLFLDAHDRIGSTSLIWLLHSESCAEPKYNTNGRLLSGTKSFGTFEPEASLHGTRTHMYIGPCHWSINAIAAVSMSLCYGAAANMVSRIRIEARCSFDLSVIDKNFSGSHYGVDVSGFALIILGGALMIQNVLSAWTLLYTLWLRKGTLLSWSLDPVVNAIYMIISTKYRDESEARIAVSAIRKSLHDQVFRARVLIRIVWGTFAAMIVAVAITIYFAVITTGFSISDVNRRGDKWQFWGWVYTLIGEGSRTTDWAGKT